MENVRLTLEYWKDDEWYVGQLRELPNVLSQGKTLEELKENIQDAYEQEILEAMADCVKKGLHYSVRGYYRRLAQTMMDAGYIDDRGNIL